MKNKIILIIIILILLNLIYYFGLKIFINNFIQKKLPEKLKLKIFIENITLNPYSGNLDLENIQVFNNDFQILFKIKSIDSKINFFSLFKKEPEIYLKKLNINNLILSFIYKNKQTNFDFLIDYLVHKREEDIEKKKIVYVINNLRFIDCAIEFIIDEEKKYSFENINLSIDRFNSSEKELNSIFNFLLNKNSNFSNRINVTKDKIEIISLINKFDLKLLNGFFEDNFQTNIINSELNSEIKIIIEKEEKPIITINGVISIDTSVFNYKNNLFSFSKLFVEINDVNLAEKIFEINKIDLFDLKGIMNYRIKKEEIKDELEEKILELLKIETEETGIISETDVQGTTIISEETTIIPTEEIKEINNGPDTGEIISSLIFPEIKFSIDTSFLASKFNIDNININNFAIKLNFIFDTLILPISFDTIYTNLINFQFENNQIRLNSKITGIINNKGKLIGKINLVNDEKGQINIIIYHLDLAELNPFLENYLGLNFEKGEFSINSWSEIMNNKLISKNEIIIKDFLCSRKFNLYEFKPDFIIDILTDNDNIFKLNITIYKDLSDTYGTIKDEILKYIKNLNEKISSETIKYLIYSNKINDIEFNKIPFEKNQLSLTNIGKKRLDIIGQLLKNRKNLKIQLVDYTTNEEYKKKEIEKIFLNRRENIIKYLTENYGIENNRIDNLNQKINLEKEIFIKIDFTGI